MLVTPKTTLYPSRTQDSFEWAREYIGIPYVSKGSDHSGLDCFGLVHLIHLEQLGIQIPRYLSDYESAEDGQGVQSAIAEGSKTWREIPFGERQIFDVITMKKRGLIWHVGLVVNDHMMLHTLCGHNAAYEDYSGIKWQKRIDGVFRWDK